MIDTCLTTKFKSLELYLSDLLRKDYYKKSKMTFWKDNPETWFVINLQKSMSNTASNLKFTVNVGIIVKLLVEEWRLPNKVPSMMDAHLCWRLGELMDYRNDKWWTIDKETDQDLLINEISSSIEKNAVPCLIKFYNVDSIIELWDSGKSPGLTDKMRIVALDKLKMRKIT